ncbi:efflux RND transporter periplasmic adaptor subunit [Halomonas sp. Bachu 37]|uniref:efflux RND transporter periplasmic adaptor subunit n=1 Tax=Halomonas kashgarensis TaxID=3084920 RepID=UPI003217F400
MRPIRSTVVGLLILLAAPLATAQDAAPSVIGSHAVATQWSAPLEALGTLRADESVTLSTTVTDIVDKIHFDDGELVEAGQLLITLEDNEERAQLRASQALRDERRNTFDRASQLQARNLAPRADVEDNQAQLRRAEADIQALEARLANYRLSAPFRGRMGFRNISVGTLVTPGMELATLDKLDVMKLDFSVPEVFLASLEPGLALSATSAAYPDETFSGTIATVGSRVDPVSRSVSVRALLDNPDMRLRPGMLMEVIVQQRPRDTVAVPESVLIPQGERQFVLVIDEADDNRISRQAVSVGERRSGEAEITAGLQGGELLVSHGVQRVRDGDQVRLLGIADEANSVRDILERNREDAD